MRNGAKGLKDDRLKTVKVTIKLPLYINDFLKNTSNKNKVIKLAVLSAYPELTIVGLELGEKYLDPDFDKTFEELKK